MSAQSSNNKHRSNDADDVDNDLAAQLEQSSLRDADRPRSTLPPPDSSESEFIPSKHAYVDKTRLLAKLLLSGKKAVYATAPRRMGKSLTVDMLGAIARGERDKFVGMDIVEDGKYDFEQYSVVQLDCSGLYRPGRSPSQVDAAFADHIREVAFDDHKFDVDDDKDAADAMKALIRALRRQDNDSKIVVTIDEYDAPVNDFLSKGKASDAEEMAEMLKPFYTMLKARKADLRFVFATGICKFSMTSMFSGPNQMTPIMEDTAEYCNLFGFTRAQVKQTYGDYMIERGFTTAEALDDKLDLLVKHYNGYRFHPKQVDADRSINPFSIMKFLATGEVENYWCHSSVSQSFVSMLGVHSFDILAGFTSTRSELFSNVSAKEIASHWKQMAFFSGYATILNTEAFTTEMGSSDHRLQLGPPNDEVTEWFKRDAVASLIGDMYEDGAELVNKYGAALQALKWETAFGEHGQALVNPRRKLHAIANEDQMKGVLASLLRRPGAPVDSRFDGVYTELQYPLPGEEAKHAKRSDAVLLFSRDDVKHLIILEFKFCGSVDEAAQQIQDKKYVARALNWLSDTHHVVIDERNVHCCGVNMKRLEDNSFELEWKPA
jgi:hypothetical protein